MKIYSLLAAALFAVPTFAQHAPQSSIGERKLPIMVKEMERNGSHDISSLFPRIAKLQQPAGNIVQKAEGETSYPTDIIIDQPSGTLIPGLYNYTTAFFPYSGWVYEIMTDGNAMDVVDAGDIFYLKNPVSTSITNSWLKGTRIKASMAEVPDTIEFKLPQLLYSEHDTIFNSDIRYYAQNFDWDEANSEFKLSDSQVARYTWDGDTLRKISTEILGLGDEGSFIGYGDTTSISYRLADTKNVLPADAQQGQYVCKYLLDDTDYAGKIVRGAKSGKDIYFADLINMPEAWIKGSINGDKAEFKPQYLGIDSSTLHHMYFYPAKVDTTENSLEVHFLDKLDFDYASASGRLSTAKDFVINPGKRIPVATYHYRYASLSPFIEKPLDPPTPKMMRTKEYDAAFGAGRLEFTFPNVNENGDFCLNDKLFYVVYLDNLTPYVFTPAKYKLLKQEMTEVPRNYDDHFDFHTNPSTGEQSIFINDPYTNIGLQTIYKGGGEVRKSNIMWYPKDPTSNVKEIDTNNASLTSITYTDLSGRRVSEPTSGLYIKTSKYSDGTVRSIKVVK